jgi:hypothetical protein
LAEARPFEPGGPLRILLAFAQSRGQVALAMRQMRERLREFFLKDVAPRYQIELDILQYGVTQGTLERAARKGGGYHIVHLFAHGHEDLLVLEDDEGQDDVVSGETIAGLLSGDFASSARLFDRVPLGQDQAAARDRRRVAGRAAGSGANPARCARAGLRRPRRERATSPANARPTVETRLA